MADGRGGAGEHQLTIWSIAIIVAWGVPWLIYGGTAEFSACGIGTSHGDVHNEYWAPVIGLPPFTGRGEPRMVVAALAPTALRGLRNGLCRRVARTLGGFPVGSDLHLLTVRSKTEF